MNLLTMLLRVCRSCIFWGNEQMLNFAASVLAVDGVDGAVQASAADQPAAGHATAAAAAAALRAARATRAGGMVFSGNHLRTNQHAGAEPAEGATLRRQVIASSLSASMSEATRDCSG